MALVYLVFYNEPVLSLCTVLIHNYSVANTAFCHLLKCVSLSFPLPLPHSPLLTVPPD